MKFIFGLLASFSMFAHADPAKGYCEKLNWGPSRYVNLKESGKLEILRDKLTEWSKESDSDGDGGIRPLMDPVIFENENSAGWTMNYSPEYMAKGATHVIHHPKIVDPLVDKVTGTYKNGRIVELNYENGFFTYNKRETEKTYIEYRNGKCVPMGWDIADVYRDGKTVVKTSISIPFCHDLLEYLKAHPQTQKPHCTTTCDTDKYEQGLSAIFGKYNRPMTRVPDAALAKGEKFNLDEFIRAPGGGPNSALKLSAYELGKCQGNKFASEILNDESVWTAENSSGADKKTGAEK